MAHFLTCVRFVGMFSTFWYSSLILCNFRAINCFSKFYEIDSMSTLLERLKASQKFRDIFYSFLFNIYFIGIEGKEKLVSYYISDNSNCDSRTEIHKCIQLFKNCFLWDYHFCRHLGYYDIAVNRWIIMHTYPAIMEIIF